MQCRITDLSGKSMADQPRLCRLYLSPISAQIIPEAVGSNVAPDKRWQASKQVAGGMIANRPSSGLASSRLTGAPP
jgi:hypothetical protein